MRSIDHLEQTITLQSRPSHFRVTITLQRPSEQCPHCTYKSYMYMLRNSYILVILLILALSHTEDSFIFVDEEKLYFMSIRWGKRVADKYRINLFEDAKC